MTTQDSINVNCANCQIRHRAVCSQCDDAELNALDKIKYYKSFSAGENIALMGDEMDFLASVVNGVATLSQTLEDGRTQMVGLLLPSDFVGRPGRKGVIYDIQAKTDILLCCFRREPFEELMVTTPHIVQRLLQMTLDELDAAREWMLVLGRKTAREKISSFFSIMAQRHLELRKLSPTDVIEFDLPLTRESMSDFLGLTLETVSRQISALKKDGVIEMVGNRHVCVPNLQTLLQEAGDDSDGGILS